MHFIFINNDSNRLPFCIVNVCNGLVLVQGLSLQWRHNGRDGISNHQPHHCLLNHLFRHRSKKTSKLRITGLCVGNSPVTGEFPTQMASNAENVSIWWCLHVFTEKTQPYWYGDPIINHRWLSDHLRFIKGILIPIKKLFSVNRDMIQLRYDFFPLKEIYRMIPSAMNCLVDTSFNNDKYSLLMHCIKIKSHAKSLLNEQYVFVGGNISFLCVLSCISEEA